MNSAPRDGTWILVGLWVQHNQQPEPHWEHYVVSYDNQTGEAYQQDFEVLPWSWDQFDAWTVIPKPPSWGKE